MKNIKFRAWDDVNDRMVYDFYNFSKENQFKTKEGCYSCGISADKNAITASLSLQKHDDFAFRHVKYIELMQYTGLKDKNGVEIYEGDIVAIENHPFQKTDVSDVGMEINGNYEVGWNADDLTWCAGSLLLARVKNYVRIVGNIHENSDLI